MACVRKDNDREGAQSRGKASPMKESQLSVTSLGIAFDEVSKNEDNEIGNRNKRNEACVLERV